MKTRNRELELYIHIPFCVRKCNYCDFLSFSVSESVRASYVEALLLEIRFLAEHIASESPEAAKTTAVQREAENVATDSWHVRSIFLGGGTPSLLTPEQIESILSAVREHFNVLKTAEITMEANPGTLTEGSLAGYKKAGVSRLSLGLQSADNACLLLLGRIHTWEDFVENYAQARACGFTNINVDLMSGLPAQTMEAYRETLERVCALRPEHISAYSLILEEGTPFFDSQEIRKKLPGEELDREMYELTKEILAGYGYQRYEISNYALPGRACVHNLGYWSGTPYLGFGLGASSCFAGCRFANMRSLTEYLENPCILPERRAAFERLSRKDEMEEFMFLGLRKMAGISRTEFHRRFGVKIETVYGKVIEKYCGMGLLAWAKDGEHLALTDAGIDVSDYIFCEFML